ncbi:MAG: L-rhamnose mutarotase [Chryseolinea sp.]
MKRFCFALDLHDDPEMIIEYDNWHARVSDEIKESITSTGIVAMDIYRIGNRMFMIVDAHDTFSLEEKSKKDAANPSVQQWEKLMWKFQKPLPFAKEGEKWMLMKQIFGL